MSHQKNKQYSFDEIQSEHDADLWLPRYVVRHRNLIVGLRLLERLNLRINDAQPQVWVGATPKVTLWGNCLANTGQKLHVYVAAPGASKYTYKGAFKVAKKKHTAAELADARQHVSHDLSRIVFLNPA